METEKSKEIRAFGLTHGDMETIRTHALHGTTPMIPANNTDTITDREFKEDFKDGFMIPAHEVEFYHVAIEEKLFDQATRERLSSARVQVFDKTTFEMLINMKPNNAFNGKSVHILHNPTKPVPVVKKTVTPMATGTSDEYSDLTTPKLAKAAYKELTGKDPVRTWTRDQAVAAIKKHKEENPK